MDELPSPKELDAKIEAYDEIKIFLMNFFDEKIRTLKEAKEALERAEAWKRKKYILPQVNEANSRVFGWLQKRLGEEKEKGHISGLEWKTSEQNTIVEFTLENKDDEKKIDGWIEWVRRRCNSIEVQQGQR